MPDLTIKGLVMQSHATAVEKGWWDLPRDIPHLLALIHCEVSEALQDYRDGHDRIQMLPSGKPAGFPIELADILIRVADLAGHLGIDLEEALAVKLQYNTHRPYRHGDKKA